MDLQMVTLIIIGQFLLLFNLIIIKPIQLYTTRYFKPKSKLYPSLICRLTILGAHATLIPKLLEQILFRKQYQRRKSHGKRD